VLGPKQLSVIVANDSDPSFIFSSFARLLGLREGTLSAPPTRTNPSLSAFEADVLAALNKIYFEHGGTLHEYRRGVLRTFDGYVNALRSGAFERSRIPPAFVGRVHELNLEVANGVRALGCNVLGDLDQFAHAGPRDAMDANKDSDKHSNQRDVDVHSAAGMMYALMVTSGVASPSAALPGFGGRASILRQQTSLLIRRLAQAVRTSLRGRT
jgi:hypothetical protein